MTDHTAGPWTATPSATEYAVWHVNAASGDTSLFVRVLGWPSHAEANARLIAAAPDLLAAARALADAWPASEDGTGSYGVPRKDVLAAREAVRKATVGAATAGDA